MTNDRSKTFYRIYAMLMIVFLIVLAEIASYALLRMKDQGDNVFVSSRHLYHPYRSHQLNPKYVRKHDTHGVRIHSDDGFRSDRNFTKNKPDNTYRIIFMGGSAAYGIGSVAPYPREPSLRNTETVSWYLEQKLIELADQRGLKRDIEVINAAVTAYTTFHHLNYFNEVLYEYEPDLLVFLDGHNDFYNYQVYNNWQRYSLGTVMFTEDYDARTTGFTLLTVVRYLARFSHFFHVVERRMNIEWVNDANPEYVQAPFKRDTEESFPDNVDQILRESIFKSYAQLNRLGELFDFSTMVFLQPQIALEDPTLLSPADKNIQAITAEHENNPRRAEIRPFFRDQFDSFGIRFEDIAEIASESTADQQLYIDYCHFSPAGAEVTASRMLPGILEIIATSETAN